MTYRVALLSLALISCTGNKGSLLVVTLTASPAISTGTVELSITAGGKTRQFDVTIANGGLPPDVLVGVEFPPEVSGAVQLSASAKEDAALVGTATATLSAGARSDVTVTIEGSASPDLQSTTDGPSTQPDLVSAGSADLSSSSDMVVLAAMLTIDQMMQDFSSISSGTSSAAATVKITNTGNIASGALTVSLSGTNGDQFSKQNDNCNGMTLAPSGFCTIDVLFNPSTTGVKNGSLDVQSSPGGSVSCSLTGTGLAPSALQVSPNPFPFGNQLKNTTSTAQTFTIINSGGVQSGTLAASLGGTNSDQFTLSNDLCSGNKLNAGTSCTVKVAFSPTSGGGKVASLLVDGGATGTASGSLSGTGQNPAVIAISAPKSHNYNDVANNATADYDFTLTNNGDVTSSAVGTSFTGNNPAQFSVPTNNCSGGVVPGTPCTITVRFTPGSNGSKSATFNVNATGTSDSATVQGNGVNPANLVIAPNVYNFHSQLVGQNEDFTFTVTNNGGVQTGAITVSVTGTGFSKLSTTCPTSSAGLAANGTCDAVVRFTPGTTGAKSGMLTMSATPGGSPTATLTGNGASTCQASSAGSLHYVDPLVGTDDANHGGDYGGCAYKTLTYALTQATGQIALMSTTYTSATETFPIKLNGSQSILCAFSTPGGARAKLAGRGAISTTTATLDFAGTANQVYNCDIDGINFGGGYCVLVEGAGVNTISGHYLTGCSIANCNGFAVYITSTGVNVTGTTFTGNSLGGIFNLADSAAVSITSNSFAQTGAGNDIQCASTASGVVGNSNTRVGGLKCTTCGNCANF